MELRVHLKICESCGCLWYRAQAEIRVYCTSCLERLKEFPTAQSRRRRGRPKKLTLPTVFAVQATAHTELDAPFHELPSQPRRFSRATVHMAALPANALIGGIGGPQ